MRVGGGSEHCQEGEPKSPAICTTLRRASHAGPVDSVSAGLIAVREPDEVAVLDAQGALVREFPFLPDEVSAALNQSDDWWRAGVSVTTESGSLSGGAS